ncbi:MAG: GIY-YIG nuclease family protein [Candidatus Kaiserbacteria bacterium]|nr:GIY-YIG nuclease family protein [Candidatus Kaiserbacteria bacterium]
MNTVRDNKGFAYVYVLQSKKAGRWYTGCTRDLRQRFDQHRAGKTTSTKGRGPLALIYYEASISDEDAFNRERYLKTGMGKRYLKNRLKRFLSLTV